MNIFSAQTYPLSYLLAVYTRFLLSSSFWVSIVVKGNGSGLAFRCFKTTTAIAETMHHDSSLVCRPNFENRETMLLWNFGDIQYIHFR